MRAPMATTVIGGLVVSTLLTLVVIPVVCDLLDRKPDEFYAEDIARPGTQTSRRSARTSTIPNGARGVSDDEHHRGCRSAGPSLPSCCSCRWW